MNKRQTMYALLGVLALLVVVSLVAAASRGGGQHPSGGGSSVSDNEKCLEDVQSTDLHMDEYTGGQRDYPGGFDNPVWQLTLLHLSASNAEIKRACADAGNPNNSAYGWEY
jgi:hypothetical protein